MNENENYGDKVLKNIKDIYQRRMYLEDYRKYYENYRDAGMPQITNIVSSLNDVEQPHFIGRKTYSILQDDLRYTELGVIDDSITSFAEINADETPPSETMSFEVYDKYLVKEMRPPLNKMYIVDLTRGKYETDEFGREVLGIVPVIVAPGNALFYQEAIRKSTRLMKQSYNIIGKVRNSYRKDSAGVFTDVVVKPFDQTNTYLEPYNRSNTNPPPPQKLPFAGLGDYLGSEPDATINDYTVSQYAAEHFPAMKFVGGRVDRKYVNQIGIVVFKAFKDTANENRISFTAVESFVGSLDRNARDVDTGQAIFLDDIVNGNSDYINVFSNANIAEGVDTNPLGLKNASIYVCRDQTACSMGFYQRDTWKNISVGKSIYDAMMRVFERSEDRNTLDVDIMVDGGVSNIAQFIASTQVYRRDPETNQVIKTQTEPDPFKRKGVYDFDQDTAYLFKLENVNDCAVWNKVVQRFDEFAKNTRKDLIYIADGPRPLCVEGNSSVIRRSKPENTVRKNILPKIKFISGVVNSSYSAGYLDWFWCLDQSTGRYMWMPPSIKALGVYLYTDNIGAYWDAPAGLNRGRIRYATDLAFNPTNDEAGQIYINSWNYAVNYPLDGIILEGQRTFQRDKTALDRVNVRRLMLGLEKAIRNMLKYFNYEGNTEFQRTRITDAIERYLEQVQANDGISQYVVVCDERNNTVQTIENNELHVAIAVRPVKTIEFIILNFIATNQTVDVEEAMQAELGS